MWGVVMHTYVHTYTEVTNMTPAAAIPDDSAPMAGQGQVLIIAILFTVQPIKLC